MECGTSLAPFFDPLFLLLRINFHNLRCVRKHFIIFMKLRFRKVTCRGVSCIYRAAFKKRRNVVSITTNKFGASVLAGSLLLALGACGGGSESSSDSTTSEKIAEAAEKVEEAGAKAANDLQQAASDAGDAIEETSANAMDGAKDAADKVGNAVGSAAESAGENIQNAAANAGEAANNAVASAKDAAAGAGEAATDVVKDASAAVSGAADAATNEVASAFAGLTGDAAKGKRVFAKCMACHTVQEGQNRVGPSLYGIVGREAGSIEGFNYTDANKNSGITWDEATLFAYLENPQEYIPGTRMIFPGLPEAQDRADVIAYLKSAAE